MDCYQTISPLFKEYILCTTSSLSSRYVHLTYMFIFINGLNGIKLKGEVHLEKNPELDLNSLMQISRTIFSLFFTSSWCIRYLRLKSIFIPTILRCFNIIRSHYLVKSAAGLFKSSTFDRAYLQWCPRVLGAVQIQHIWCEGIFAVVSTRPGFLLTQFYWALAALLPQHSIQAVLSCLFLIHCWEIIMHTAE